MLPPLYRKESKVYHLKFGNMQKENQPYKIEPASRLSHVSEYYFSRKLKEV